jgi:hypothetical protein
MPCERYLKLSALPSTITGYHDDRNDKPSNCGADLGDTADDLMSWNAWIDSRHRAPLVTDLMEVRVANTTEKDFDLNIMFTRIASGDCDGIKW